MDLSQHLADLKTVSPRSFDKRLIEVLIEATQRGEPLVAPARDVGLRKEVETLRKQVEDLSQALADAAADRAQILEMLRLSGVLAAATHEGGPVDLLNTSKALDGRISSFAVKVERAA